MAKNSQHIILKDAKGRWAVKKDGSSKTIKYFNSKQEAFDWGRQAAKKQKDEKTSQHIVKDAKGGWVVKKGGSSKATKYFDKKQDAIDWGRKVAKNQKAELYIHSKDGKIRSKDSYGSAPFPLKDKK